MTENIRGFLLNVTNILLGIVLFFLGLRIIFRFLGANGAAPFVSWIYTISDYLMNPFRGMLPQIITTNGFVVDTSAIIALIIYGLLAYLFAELVSAVSTHYHSQVEDQHAHYR